MSRSLHTDPLGIRARRRVRAPHATRHQGDHRRYHGPARALKADGIILEPPGAPLVSAPQLPRIIEHAPPPGFHHPAGAAGIARLLVRIDARYWYKLQRIELRPPPVVASHSRQALGCYVLPGTIILYAQPAFPWRIAAATPPADLDRLRMAGALVEHEGACGAVLIHWPAGALRRFMLGHVLPHELAHHQLHLRRHLFKERIARTGDHEAFARVCAGIGRAAIEACSRL